MFSLIEMLRYKRPEGSETQKEFCRRFLEPVFGEPDAVGNYVLTVGDKPRLCFTAHHDTVHKTDGMQDVVLSRDIVSVADAKVSSCLGADCTTGIYVLLNMIDHGVEGTYVVHAAEEVGCKGSSALVSSNPDWLRHTDAVISFDRYGDKSVITHQMGLRTASDEFAASFADAVGLPQLKADDGGSYTDSNEYAQIVPECTNISVGYYGQHGINETQDLDYLEVLVTAVCLADWSKLVIARDPAVIDDLYDDFGRATRSGVHYDDDNTFELEMLIQDYPQYVAELLSQYGFTPTSLMEECGIEDMATYYNYSDNHLYNKRVS